MGLQNDYKYDIRGWLKSINNLADNTPRKLYAQQLAYNNNGNIASMIWKNNQQPNKQQYDFTYDGLNRLDNAEYSERNPSNQVVEIKAGFFDENPGYDLNGNITAMARQGNKLISGFGKGLIDNLFYTYNPNSNQISSISDNGEGAAHLKEFKNLGGTFAYDANGNATTVPHKSSTITYNYLNLPSQVTISGQNISYLYDASGNKLQKTYAGINSYYQGSVLKIIDQTIVLTGEGRAVKNGNGNWGYEYDLKDHLGNTRISFAADNAEVSVLQTKDYYPFGMEMANNYVNSPATKYLYNGKELQDEGGLDMYDYGARFYDPAIGRWHSVDPLAEQSRRWSPYSYCYNNPMRFIDPDGMEASDFKDKDDNLVSHVDDGSNAVYQQKGSGTNLHYELKKDEYSDQGGKNEVTPQSVTSATQEQQNLNMNNSSLKDVGLGTHCNQATQNVQQTVESATGKDGVVTAGRANDMAGSLATSTVYKSVDQATAEKSAAGGKLAIAAFQNTEKDSKGNIKSGHVATLSVGTNVSKGTLANIGTKGSTGFVPIKGSSNAAFRATHDVKYYILKDK